MPSMPRIAGKINTAPISKISVRVNAATAETIPLFKAVNKADENIFIPHKMKLSMYMR